jgi:D-proline reductase (dithiol) PrdB
VSPRFVGYIEKSREYYAAQGYPFPYRWADNDEAPFAALPRPLSECRVGLVTTTTPLEPGETTETDADLRAPKAAYAAPADPVPAAMYTADLSWDKAATHTRDVETFLPIRALRALVTGGRIGSASERFYGVPTDYSQRRTRQVDAPEILQLCQRDGVDVAVLVPI